MSQPIARYSVSFGLSGCYLPDSYGGAHEFYSRKELAEFIRHELEFHELPKSLFEEVGIRRLWSFIRDRGSSCAHFSLHHKGYCLAFSGLTEDEFLAQSEEV